MAPKTIEIPSFEALLSMMGEQTKALNKDLLTGLSNEFRTAIAEEGAKLIKDAGLPPDYDLEDLPDDVGEKVGKEVRAAVSDAEKGRAAQDRINQKIAADYVSKVIKEERVKKFEFGKDIGEKAVKALSTAISLPTEQRGARSIS